MSKGNAAEKLVENELSANDGVIDAINRVQAVIEFELDGTIITANDNFCTAVGYSLDEIKGQHHRIFCESDYHSSLEYKQFWKNFSEGEFDSGEYKRITKSGEEIWILASYNPVFDISGNPVKVIKFATDITAEKIRAADLEGKHQAIGKTQAEIEFTLDGHVIAANDNFLNAVGYSLSEIEGKHHAIFCDADYAQSEEYKDFWKKLRSGESDSGEYKRKTKAGEDIWINASYNPILDPDGRAFKVVKYATDITESKVKSAVYVGKVAAIGRAQAVIEFNLDGTIIEANDNFLAATGYSQDEIVGQHHRMFCASDYSESDEYKEFWKKLRSGQFDSGEYKRITKAGDEIWINASYNPILNANGEPYRVVKFAVDVTAQKISAAENQGKMQAIDKAMAVIEFNPDGSIITANEAFTSTLDYSLDEIIGKHHRMFCEKEYSASAAYASFWEQLSAGEYQAGRFKRIGNNGNVIWIEASYNPIFDLNGKVYKVVKYATNATAQVEVEESVTTIAEEFAISTKEIADKASMVADGAQVLGATTEEMNASVEELSASIDSIAENSKEADNVAKSTQHEADLGSKAIDKSIESMELINKSSEEISEIVKVIGEIASQTNLLAFNAAIEAARAGEHGLGFSVVADEVRKLAERSSQATKEITKLINESVKRVVQGGEISKEAAQAFGKIVEGVAKTTHSISEISTAAQEQQTAARDVSNAIQQIVEATENSATASDSIASSTHQLQAGADTLKTEVSKFSK
ncbi:MAG: PAS domain-containing protein [Granulosicoccus sp.]